MFRIDGDCLYCISGLSTHTSHSKTPIAFTKRKENLPQNTLGALLKDVYFFSPCYLLTSLMKQDSAFKELNTMPNTGQGLGKLCCRCFCKTEILMHQTPSVLRMKSVQKQNKTKPACPTLTLALSSLQSLNSSPLPRQQVCQEAQRPGHRKEAKRRDAFSQLHGNQRLT